MRKNQREFIISSWRDIGNMERMISYKYGEDMRRRDRQVMDEMEILDGSCVQRGKAYPLFLYIL